MIGLDGQPVRDAAGNVVMTDMVYGVDYQTLGPVPANGTSAAPVTAQAPGITGTVQNWLIGLLNRIPGVKTNDGYRAMFLAWAIILLIPGGLLIWFLFFRRKSK